MVQLLTYVKMECKKTEFLVQCIDRLTIKKMHVITEILKLSTYILALIFV